MVRIYTQVPVDLSRIGQNICRVSGGFELYENTEIALLWVSRVALESSALHVRMGIHYNTRAIFFRATMYFIK
jgi:hypothetical protein